MSFKRFIPNSITLLNLFSGTLAAYFASNNELVYAAYFILLGIFFDFFDGFAARLLKVSSETGKQLDSLADMVTSGVAPGLIMFQLLSDEFSFSNISEEFTWNTSVDVIPFIGLLITLAAAYRLAKFNLDERQTTSFIGLPTPASALVILSIPLIMQFNYSEAVANVLLNNWFLIVLTVVLAILMNAELPLFSLKFKDFSIKNNIVKYIFILITLLLILTLQFVAIPIIVFLYVVISIIENSFMKPKVV